MPHSKTARRRNSCSKAEFGDSFNFNSQILWHENATSRHHSRLSGPADGRPAGCPARSGAAHELTDMKYAPNSIWGKGRALVPKMQPFQGCGLEYAWCRKKTSCAHRTRVAYDGRIWQAHRKSLSTSIVYDARYDLTWVKLEWFPAKRPCMHPPSRILHPIERVPNRLPSTQVRKNVTLGDV